MQGFFIDKNNILYREAFIGRKGKLVSLSDDGYEVKVKDKTALVMNTTTETTDGRWLVNDIGEKRSGLLLLADEPMAAANMHDLYDDVPCAPIKRNLDYGIDTRVCWEFCEETDAMHYLLKVRWWNT